MIGVHTQQSQLLKALKRFVLKKPVRNMKIGTKLIPYSKLKLKTD
jgi:hypothetical protein